MASTYNNTAQILREPIKYLKCIVYIRPTPDNLHLLQEELRNPRYAQYYICEWGAVENSLLGP